MKLYLEFLKQTTRSTFLSSRIPRYLYQKKYIQKKSITHPVVRLLQEVLEPRNSIYHTALTLQNAFMHSGTTSNLFLRDNLEWLGMASNWSKFSATAALGVIHKGDFEEGMTILGPYLPQTGDDSPIQGTEGGALYALGLIHAGCGSGRSVKNPEAYDDLKQTLFTDSAVAGEVAGYAMGLILLGTADANIADEMLTYARETQHEKIIRGLAVGVGFIYYRRQEKADATIKLLLAEKVCPSLMFLKPPLICLV